MVLYEAGFSSVVPLPSYEALERKLLDGEIDAAWGPPMVCARVQQAGGTVALRAIRGNASVYRAALLCRSHDDLKLQELGALGLRRLRAAWVDPQSMAGYIMPRRHLSTAGIDLRSAFEEEQILGSYEACFEAVISCQADVTASYATARGLGYVELCGADARHLRVFAYSDECSSDGLIVGPRVANSPDICRRLASLLQTASYRSILCAALNVDDLDVPPGDAYESLLKPC